MTTARSHRKPKKSGLREVTLENLVLSYSAVLLIFRLTLGVLLLLWLPYTEPNDEIFVLLQPVWHVQALIVVIYCLYCICLFGLAPQHRRSQAIGSFIDIAFITLLILQSGGKDSPFTGLYLALTAITSFHFGLGIGLAHGLLGGLLWGLSIWEGPQKVVWVQLLFALTGPVYVAFLCGVLRTGRVPTMLGFEVSRKGETPDAAVAGDWMALQILAVIEGQEAALGPRCSRMLEERARRFWQKMGIRSAGVFVPRDRDHLVLAWSLRAGDLAEEIGALTIPREVLAELEPGLSILPPGSPLGQTTLGFFPDWTYGEKAVILAPEADRPEVLVVATSAAGSFAEHARQALERAAGKVLAAIPSPVQGTSAS